MESLYWRQSRCGFCEGDTEIVRSEGWAPHQPHLAEANSQLRAESEISRLMAQQQDLSSRARVCALRVQTNLLRLRRRGALFYPHNLLLGNDFGYAHLIQAFGEIVAQKRDSQKIVLRSIDVLGLSGRHGFVELIR